MQATKERMESIATLLEWMQSNLPLNKKVLKDRVSIMNETGVSIGYLSKTMTCLISKGYIRFKNYRSQPSEHTALKDLSTLTPKIVSTWITAYQTELARKSRKNRNSDDEQEGDESNAFDQPPIESTQANPGANPGSLFMSTISRVYGDAELSQEPQIVSTLPTPLTPVQQLLAEVQKLADQEASRKSEPEVLPDQLKGLESRLNRLESSTNIILYFFQQASTALRALPPAQLPFNVDSDQAPLPDLEPTKRVKINRLVDGYAAAKTVSHQEIWKHLYGNLSSRFGFDAWQHAEGKKDPNYLEIVEKYGQLDNLYSIAVELLTLSQR